MVSHIVLLLWLQIQELGLTQSYRDKQDVRHFCGMVDSFAYLQPIADMEEGLQYLRDNTPDVPGLDALLDYFAVTYVKCMARRPQTGHQLVLRIRQLAPHFLPSMWNVHEATLNGGSTWLRGRNHIDGGKSGARLRLAYAQHQLRF